MNGQELLAYLQGLSEKQINSLVVVKDEDDSGQVCYPYNRSLHEFRYDEKEKEIELVL